MVSEKTDTFKIKTSNFHRENRNDVLRSSRELAGPQLPKLQDVKV
jgi:hypothetical protein